jgi:MFS family permease
MNTREKWTILILGSAHTMVHFYEQAFPALLLTMVAYFQIDLRTAGWMQTLLALAFGVGALPAGYLADRIGSKRIVMVYLIGAAGACMFISYSNSVTTFAIGLAALGAFISLYHPAGTTLVTVQVKQIGKGLGYHGMGGALGVALAPLLAVSIAALSPTDGWRLSFRAFAALGLLGAAGVATLKVAPTQRSTETARRFWPERIITEGQMKPFVIYLFVAVMVGFCYRGLMTFLPTYFAQELTGGIFAGSDLVKGGRFATITLLVGIFGQFLGGQLTTRYNLEKLYAVLLIVTVPMLFLMSVTTNYALFFITMAFAFFHFAGQPVGNNLVARYTDQRGRGLGFGIYFAAAFGIGSIASGFSGVIADRYGLGKIFFALGALIFLGFLAMLYLAKDSGSGPDPKLDA